MWERTMGGGLDNFVVGMDQNGQQATGGGGEGGWSVEEPGQLGSVAPTDSDRGRV